MNNAEIILDMQDRYDAAGREDILENIKVALYVSEHNGKNVNIYKDFPTITGKSKFTIAGWFNNSSNKKIPLYNLVKIMDHLTFNIYTILSDPGSISTVIKFKTVNEQMNEKYGNDCNSIYIKAFDLQYETDKDIVISNIEKHYGSADDMIEHHLDERMTKIMEVCGCTKDTYHAWFNRSRKNVKIPLLYLCKLSIDMGVDVFDLFK